MRAPSSFPFDPKFFLGFGKKLDVHQKLVYLLIRELGELLVDPSMGWDATLDSIWQRRKNIIVSYDYISVVQEHPSHLWHSVQQRWDNVQTLIDLKRHLSARSFAL